LVRASSCLLLLLLALALPAAGRRGPGAETQADPGTSDDRNAVVWRRCRRRQARRRQTAIGGGLAGGGDVASVRAQLVFRSWLIFAGGCAARETEGEVVSLHPPARPAQTAVDCGGPSLPPCPLQSWMDAHLAQSLQSGRLDRLVEPLEALALAAPPRYSAWGSIARAGATSAARNEPEGVRAACGRCHIAFRDRYRGEMRSSPLPAALRGQL
jgi:hypothetical protein